MDKKQKDQKRKKGQRGNVNTYLYNYSISDGKWFDVMQSLRSAKQTYTEPAEQAIAQVNAAIEKYGGSASLQRE